MRATRIDAVTKLVHQHLVGTWHGSLASKPQDMSLRRFCPWPIESATNT